jgi:HEAT repeat protein
MMMTNLMKLIIRRRGLAVLTFLTLALTVGMRARLAYGSDQDIQRLNRFVQGSKSTGPSMKMFREGRDLIEAQNWPQAAEKFNNFISEFPKDRDLDAALYWYAYALQKQGKKDEAAAPLQRLIKEFPNSSWRREAEAMLVVLGRGDAIKQALSHENCEIKTLALQSLFEADEDRAIGFVNEVLKANNADCPTLKYAAVSLLGSHGGARSVPLLLEIARNQSDLKLRLTAIRQLGEQNDDAVADELTKLYEAEKTREVRVQILRAFAEMNSAKAEAKLIELARAGGDLEMRQMAVRFLGEHHGEASLDELIRMFDTDRSPEIRSQILRALSERNEPKAQAKLLDVARKGETPSLRLEAIRRLGEHGGAALPDLLLLYATEPSVEIKQGLIRAYSEMNDPRAVARLVEIARGNDGMELRMSAIRRLGEQNDDQALAQLISLYDADNNPEIKVALIRAFAESHETSAVRKLIAIARSDQSVEMRKLAVRRLGESQHPEALKFLEDLLK